MSAIVIPRQLADAVDEDDHPARRDWLAALPEKVDELASGWALELGEPYDGGQCSWVAPARDARGEDLVLKVEWRHPEAEHEADALRCWDGDGAVRCRATRTSAHTIALVLERCKPGTPLGRSVAEPEQDVVVADLLRRLWEHHPPDGHPFRPLQEMCDEWADTCEAASDRGAAGFDAGLFREGLATLRELPGTADRSVLLCTDLHAGNVLSAQREPWLAIDPKPYMGDPAYDAVQHMLNCDERLARDPAGLARRMAQLADVDPERVRLWLFARCVQESLYDVTLREPARRLVR